MLMNAGRIVVIMIATLMPIVSIKMDHMTVNVKLALLAMVLYVQPIFALHVTSLQDVIVSIKFAIALLDKLVAELPVKIISNKLLLTRQRFLLTEFQK